MYLCVNSNRKRELIALAVYTNMPQSLWMTEFGPEYQVPPELETLVAQGLASEYSWHNDISPSFGKEVVENDSDGSTSNVEYRIWSQHPDESKRDFLTGRFNVSKIDMDSGDGDTLLETDDINQAIQMYLQLTKQNAQQQPVDTEGRIYDLSRNRNRTQQEESELAELLKQRGTKPAYMASAWVRSVTKFAQHDEDDHVDQIAPLLAKGLVEESDDFEHGKYKILSIPAQYGEWFLQYEEADTGRGFAMGQWSVTQDEPPTIWWTENDATYGASEAYKWAMKHYMTSGQPATQVSQPTPAPKIDVEGRIYDLSKKMRRTPEEEAELASLLQQRGSKPTYMASWVLRSCRFASAKVEGR